MPVEQGSLSNVGPGSLMQNSNNFGTSSSTRGKMDKKNNSVAPAHSSVNLLQHQVNNLIEQARGYRQGPAMQEGFRKWVNMMDERDGRSTRHKYLSWLIKTRVQEEGLSTPTMHLCIDLFDRYMAIQKMKKVNPYKADEHYRVVAITSLTVAIKLLEHDFAVRDDFDERVSCFAERLACTSVDFDLQVVPLEVRFLNELEFRLAIPTTMDVVDFAGAALEIPNDILCGIMDLARFAVDSLVLHHPILAWKHGSSAVAISVLLICGVREETLRKLITLETHEGLDEEVAACVEELKTVWDPKKSLQQNSIKAAYPHLCQSASALKGLKMDRTWTVKIPVPPESKKVVNEALLFGEVLITNASASSSSSGRNTNLLNKSVNSASAASIHSRQTSVKRDKNKVLTEQRENSSGKQSASSMEKTPLAKKRRMVSRQKASGKKDKNQKDNSAVASTCSPEQDSSSRGSTIPTGSSTASATNNHNNNKVIRSCAMKLAMQHAGK